MTVDIQSITSDQAVRILGLEEGHFADLKATAIKPSKLSRTISAFANADGGELFIGVLEHDDENREWLGFKNVEAANGHLQAFEKLFPLGENYSYEFLRKPASKTLVLHVQVRKSGSIAVASDGIPYLRRGAQNLPVATEESLRQLKLNKGIVSFENEKTQASLDDVANSITALEFILEVIPTSEPAPWLRKQRLLIGDSPTVAGVVLFSDLPQAVLPKRSGIKIYRYKTSESEGARETLAGDPVSIEGPAYALIGESVAKTQEIVDSVKVLAEAGLEQVSYPPEALHEVITNSVLHRDYSIADDIHIRVFDNRVEVQSPGSLPAHITPSNILDERFARNGNIVRIINKFPNPPNKDVGEGLNTAFAAMRKHKLKDPIIVERSNSVVVQIRHEALASAEELVLEYLCEHKEITNSIARSVTGIESENEMKRCFYRLQKADLLQQVAGRSRRYAAWELTEKGSHQARGA